MSPRFDRMYSDMGRPSIPPEQLLRALLLQSLYMIRSERLLMEEIDYSILFRWFVGLGMDEAVTVGGDKAFDVSSFVAHVRALGVTPHVAQKGKYAAIDGRTTHHEG